MGDGSHYDSTPDGEFRWGLDGLIGCKQARETGIRLSKAHEHPQEQGYATGTAPYSYRYERQTAGEKWPQMVADEETAPVLQRIFQTYAASEASAKQIAEMLHRTRFQRPSATGTATGLTVCGQVTSSVGCWPTGAISLSHPRSGARWMRGMCLTACRLGRHPRYRERPKASGHASSWACCIARSADAGSAPPTSPRVSITSVAPNPA